MRESAGHTWGATIVILLGLCFIGASVGLFIYQAGHRVLFAAWPAERLVSNMLGPLKATQWGYLNEVMAFIWNMPVSVAGLILGTLLVWTAI